MTAIAELPGPRQAAGPRQRAPAAAGPHARDDRAVGAALRAGVPVRDGPARGGGVHGPRRRQRDPARAPGRLSPLAQARDRDRGARAHRPVHVRGRRLAPPAPARGHRAQLQPPAPLLRDHPHRHRPPAPAAAGTGTPVAILDDFMAYSVDVTSALAFGHDLNTLERGDGELQRHIRASSSCWPAAPVAGPVLARGQAAGRSRGRALARGHPGGDRGFIAAARARMRPGPNCARRPRTSSRACCDARLQRARRDRQRVHDAVRGRGHDRQHARLGDVPARARPGRAGPPGRPRPTPSWATSDAAAAEASTGCASPRPCSARRRG